VVSSLIELLFCHPSSKSCGFFVVFICLSQNIIHAIHKTNADATPNACAIPSHVIAIAS
jgi:hypothetical protein